MEFLGALEAEKLTKQKWEQYCGTPCMYNNIRTAWYSKLTTPPNFDNLDIYQKLKIVLSAAENVKVTAQFLVDICNVRSKLLFKKSADNTAHIF